MTGGPADWERQALWQVASEALAVVFFGSAGLSAYWFGLRAMWWGS